MLRKTYLDDAYCSYPLFASSIRFYHNTLMLDGIWIPKEVLFVEVWDEGHGDEDPS